MLWEVKDGTEIDHKDMTTQHIKNCMGAIVNKRLNKEWIKDYGQLWWTILDQELSLRRLHESE